MLEYLRIQNLALIADMELEFAQGMNVVTGETGAGKSFILKAINCLMGDKFHTDIVRPGKERAQVEALFIHPEEGELILRRELSSTTGRSRFFINDSLSSVEALKNLKGKLVTHTSQHGQQKLLQTSFQEHVIDSWANKPELFAQKAQIIDRIKTCLAKKELLSARLRTLEEKRDVFAMYLEEINKVSPKLDEEERLEEQKKQFKLSGVIKKGYEEALTILCGGDISLYDLLSSLEKNALGVAAFDDSLAPYVRAIADFKDKLYDFERALRQSPYSSRGSEVDIEKIEERLFALAQLKRKLRRSLPEVLALKEETEENLSFLDSCALDIRQIEKERARLLEDLRVTLDMINEERLKAGRSFCHKLKEELVDLGFSDFLDVFVDFVEYEAFPGCVEKKVRFFWAPNPGQPPRPLERIASGGELSRFLLALISIRSNSEDGMLIFDEIDAGIGGQTLKVVARKLTAIAKQKQILVVTHWPQIAAQANRHFYVVKDTESDGTYTRCKQLDGAEKEKELSRMACV